MAMLEADVRGDAEAIMQILSRRHRIMTVNDDSNAPDVPDTPPVAPAAVGQGQEQSSNQGQNSEQGEGQISSQAEGQSSEGQSSSQAEGQSDGQQETPMETDKPGNGCYTL